MLTVLELEGIDATTGEVLSETLNFWLVCEETVEDDCLGDMIAAMDGANWDYAPNASDDEIRRAFKAHVLTTLRTLCDRATTASVAEVNEWQTG